MIEDKEILEEDLNDLDNIENDLDVDTE